MTRMFAVVFTVVFAGCSRPGADQPAAATDPSALEHFTEALRETKVMPAFISKVRRGDSDTVVVSVTKDFFATRKLEQKSLLQAVWAGWAKTRCPGRLDACYLKAEDQLGNRIGGSGLVGSLVSLEDQ